MSEPPIRIAVIGGSGLYRMPQLEQVEELEVDTPFGPPSDKIIMGRLGGVRAAFLPRHGRGHVLSPTEVPYRANIFALKLLGIERIISISACGSLREDYAPGQIVIPDQLYDNTSQRPGRTFFGEGLVVHVGVDQPFCPDLSRMLARSTSQVGGTVHEGGAFVTIEGPRFSTRAESNVFRSWGMSLVGMTTSPEAQLAREAEMCYSVMAHVTDYDVWHESVEPVTADKVIQTLDANLHLAQDAVSHLIPALAQAERTCSCQTALAAAMITDKRKIPPETLARLKPIIGKYLSE
jgi:5'-methylthioadenosine phosphorylase